MIIKSACGDIRFARHSTSHKMSLQRQIFFRISLRGYTNDVA